MDCNEVLESRERMDQFVAAWETGTLPKSRWTHAAHVAVCSVLIVRYPDDALVRMTEGITRYNESVGTVNSDTSGYHATLTRFWFDVLSKRLAGYTDEWRAARDAVAEFGDARDLHSRFYSFDVIRNREARLVWVAPDLLDHRSAF